jgi:hypothetical protein
LRRREPWRRPARLAVLGALPARPARGGRAPLGDGAAPGSRSSRHRGPRLALPRPGLHGGLARAGCAAPRGGRGRLRVQCRSPGGNPLMPA